MGSFFLSPYLVLVNVIILLLLARYLGLHDRAYSDALSALLPIVKIMVRWICGDPDGCRKWCTELSSKFNTVFVVVGSDGTVKRYIAENSKAHA
jgi:Ni,Fe-hydrogenase I cytochrome b subunit